MKIILISILICLFLIGNIQIGNTQMGLPGNHQFFSITAASNTAGLTGSIDCSGFKQLDIVVFAGAASTVTLSAMDPNSNTVFSWLVLLSGNSGYAQYSHALGFSRWQLSSSTTRVQLQYMMECK